PSPSFLAMSADGRRLYAVNETGDYAGAKTGSVSAFSRDPQTGMLRLINAVSSHGSYPCHIAMAKSGRRVLLANYGSGTVAVLPIKEDGALGDACCVIQHAGSSVNKSRQEGPHAHSINLDRDNRFALACDLGTDEVIVYRFDSRTGALTRSDSPPAKVAPGAGPRHLAFHPAGRFVYVINELDSTIAAYRFDQAGGALTLIEAARTLPEGFTGASTTAEVAVHPSGKWVYGSNRGHDSIAVFAVNASTGALRPIGHEPTLGKTPRNFTLDRAGRFLIAANQDASGVVVMSIDQRTGGLQPTEHRAEVPLPVCVRFAPV
ncbi:MAG: lactonase family protein, partial [Armatimonadetes bacterium]|nr:lactonase family protein [Armatimonadota bacterium]